MIRGPLLVVALLMAGCASEESSDLAVPSQTPHEPFASDGASFAGVIPCASCPGIEINLTLNADRTFFLESVYLEADEGEDRVVADMGRWASNGDDSMLILRGGEAGAKRFHIVGNDTLEVLNPVGEPIDSALPYYLARTDAGREAGSEILMNGLYRYMADAAMFFECRTRKRYPVVFEEDHIELERAYLAASVDPGQPLFASFTGRIETRPRIEGEGDREFVVVSDFQEVDPDKSCFDHALPLEGTVWRLTEMNGNVVSIDDPRKQPHVMFIAEDSTASGSGGCNRFTGSYHAGGDRSLRIGELASTMMACPDMDLESQYLQVLESTSTFEHYGDVLELWTDGRFLARFEGESPSPE